MVCMQLNLTVGMSEQNTVEELTHLLRVTTEVNRVRLGDCVTRNSLVTDCGGLLREKKLSIQTLKERISRSRPVVKLLCFVRKRVQVGQVIPILDD